MIQEKKPKMNATNAKSFNAMRQKMKKLVKEYEVDLENYKKVTRNVLGEAHQQSRTLRSTLKIKKGK